MMQLPILKPVYVQENPKYEAYLKALAMGVTIQEVFLDDYGTIPAVIVKMREERNRRNGF